MPDIHEMVQTIQDCKNNKSTSEDGMVAELLKIGSTEVVTAITALLMNIWEMKRIPADLLMTLIHPLHKKGDKRDVTNYI